MCLCKTAWNFHVSRQSVAWACACASDSWSAVAFVSEAFVPFKIVCLRLPDPFLQCSDYGARLLQEVPR